MSHNAEAVLKAELIKSLNIILKDVKELKGKIEKIMIENTMPYEPMQPYQGHELQATSDYIS